MIKPTSENVFQGDLLIYALRCAGLKDVYLDRFIATETDSWGERTGDVEYLTIKTPEQEGLEHLLDGDLDYILTGSNEHRFTIQFPHLPLLYGCELVKLQQQTSVYYEVFHPPYVKEFANRLYDLYSKYWVLDSDEQTALIVMTSANRARMLCSVPQFEKLAQGLLFKDIHLENIERHSWQCALYLKERIFTDKLTEKETLFAAEYVEFDIRIDQ